ncbi:cupin domain-containing protein [Devosia lacusdianchii]|jgi:mannose-6-phosphate isomerase-like protein (cupin superfamily)|uniref:cupin domain-containing protein n=1 Tax=Devosia lacusdianchii TaxID=2917991 RepID=UPI001F0574B3|nr:cupin domain-containing protein [Devosia sp. JXJ CY 41]
MAVPRKINLVGAAESQIDGVWQPHIAGDINDSQVKIAKFGDVFDWHAHEAEDEGFLVLKGRIAIDFRDGSVELGEGDFLVVPRGVEHRPRSLTSEPIVLMVEPSTTLNTGNAQSELTVTQLNRLQ